MKPGYTDHQAVRQLRRLDRNLARAEDALAGLSRTTPDTHESPHLAQEVARESADRQARIVARRLRTPISPRIFKLGLTAISDELEHRIDLAKRKERRK